MRESDPLTVISGIGPKTEAYFKSLGVCSLLDMLLFFPRTYKKYPLPKDHPEDEGEYCAVTGSFERRPVTRRFRGLTITTDRLYSESGDEIEVIWYRMPYIEKSIKLYNKYVVYGRVSNHSGHLRFEQPALFDTEKYYTMTKRPAPVYHLTKGLSNNTVSKAVDGALSICLPLKDPIPGYLLNKNQLPDINRSLINIHKPDSDIDIENSVRRFSYQEFLIYFLTEELQRSENKDVRNKFFFKNDSCLRSVTGSLPFELTGGQKKALSDIIEDMNGLFVTERLIQGDVGSGKTAVAFLSMIYAAENHYQSALMAPTEVLCDQHFEKMIKLISENNLPFKAVCLKGGMKQSDRKDALNKIKSGEADFIIGTHALISDNVTYHNLCLVITDEQHRFGVRQRAVLMEKGEFPFSVIMSATPIPRTLSLILYKGMNVSEIRDVPKSRKKILTAILKSSERNKAWKFISDEVAKGHQAYIICPFIEESETMDGENVTDYMDLYQKNFPEIKSGMLHGRMSLDKKNDIMKKFKEHEIDVLISTTVVEVGVDVANATVILIENADRFGLTQLHQLRGRVGRGDQQSFCILMDSSNGKNQNASKRLSALQESRDGFEVAEKDLILRGPGDIKGTRQSGEAGFFIADSMRNPELLKEAADDAANIIKDDPMLCKDENKDLRKICESKDRLIYTNL
jgi:ATP-dependent DNA helicase RecG